MRFVHDAIQGHYWINWEKYCGFWRAYRLTQKGKKENGMLARRKLSAHSSLIPPRMFPMQYWLGYILWQWGSAHCTWLSTHRQWRLLLGFEVWRVLPWTIHKTELSHTMADWERASLRLNRGVRKGRVTERENRSCWIVCTIMFSHMWGVTEICILHLWTASQHEQDGSSKYVGERQEIRICNWHT